MQTVDLSKAEPGPTKSDLRTVLRAWAGDRRVLAAAGLAVIGAGLALGWNWLVAAGIAPLIVAAAPCLLMCAFGLCMMGKGQQGCGPQKASVAEDDANTEIGSNRPVAKS